MKDKLGEACSKIYGKATEAQQAKVAKVMGEHKEGTLKSSSGQPVTERKQAVAIALSEAGLSRKRKKKG